MKRYIKSNQEAVMTMANIHKVRTGLNVNIWSDGEGCLRNKPDHKPRVKLSTSEGDVSVSIEPEPKILAPKQWKNKFKQQTLKDIEAGMAYVGRNYDLFLQHYNDTDGTFDDLVLFEALKERGQLK